MFSENIENRPILEIFDPFDDQHILWPHCFDYEKLPPIPLA